MWTVLVQIYTLFFLLAASFIIYLIAAIISQWRKNVRIWTYASYFLFTCLVFSIITHYADGAHYIGPIWKVMRVVIFSLTTLIVPILLHTNKIRKWNMWLYTFILPIFIASAGMYMAIDWRPMSKQALEAMFGTEMPRYKVVEYKEFSPGGDDWERTCTIQLYECDILDDFYRIVEENCMNEEGTYEDFDCYSQWSIVGENYQFYDKMDIENWMIVTIDKEANKIHYHTVKI